ncbi:N-acetyltransferase [Flavobacterium rakeshii]|uniref:N-acetyltransferase n=1 Tax=Flavobacterium rakeshii TaxID=1038845 RepID=A0A6N8HF96_9FLAO|nr:N-acetyltransferase [Flavobacterium rakeshii]MEE1898620.1 hypothetical protein [Flavobacterium rakeshii]MUV04378.1 N-acetyltransferase [Flavobacterium rakeshii]
MNVTTKFIIATEQGMDIMRTLTHQLAKEKFSSLIDKKTLDNYITENFNDKELITELNSLSNQWIVVYADDNPAGYVKITSKGIKPNSFEDKRAMRIADFGVLKKYDRPEIKHSLLKKCISVCKLYEGIWLNEYIYNPLIPFFEDNGFQKQTGNYEFEDLALSSVLLIYLVN